MRVGLRLCQPSQTQAPAYENSSKEGATYRHVIAIHVGEMLRVRIKPTFGTEGVWVGTEYCRVAVGYPGVYADGRLTHIDTRISF